MNLRILIYLNPSNINKVTHKFNLNQDSGFIIITKSIDALNKICENHYYLLIPPNTTFSWIPPKNVTLIEYPYINDALNSRYHFDTVALNKYFNNYRHDIDLCWCMLPEVVANLKAFFNKRREEIPIYCYSNWLQNSNGRYEPSYKWRTIEGYFDCSAFGYQSDHMYKFMMSDIFNNIEMDTSKFIKINPKTNTIDDLSDSKYDDIIVFNHRISKDSYFSKMVDLIKDDLDMTLWVTNINNGKGIQHDKIIYECIEDRDEYFKKLQQCRFGVSYHIGYSMWCMSVLDLMSCAKVVLAPKKNAFIEIFGEDYPYFFESKEEFLAKFKELQTVDISILKKWGEYNRLRVEDYFSWTVMAKELNQLFLSLITTKTTKNTPSVLSVIQKYNAIAKGEMINKNLTKFGRRCSRAWNKCRIELMRDYGIKDDITSEHTIFYINKEEYLKDGVKIAQKRNINKLF